MTGIEILAPMGISPRLMAGVRIQDTAGDRSGWISIEPAGQNADGHQQWNAYIDVNLEGELYAGQGISSPSYVYADAAGTRSAMSSTLAFLIHDGNTYAEATEETEYSFNAAVAEWAHHMTSEIEQVQYEFEQEDGYPSEG